jgi:hypothetical protein
MEFYEIDKPNSCLRVQELKLGIDCSSFHLMCMTKARQRQGASHQPRESSSTTSCLAGEEDVALDREREAPQDGGEGVWLGDRGRNVNAMSAHPLPLVSRAPCCTAGVEGEGLPLEWNGKGLLHRRLSSHKIHPTGKHALGQAHRRCPADRLWLLRRWPPTPHLLFSHLARASRNCAPQRGR